MANLASAYFPANPNLVMDCHSGPTADFSTLVVSDRIIRFGNSAEWLLRRDSLILQIKMIIPNRIFKSYFSKRNKKSSQKFRNIFFSEKLPIVYLCLLWRVFERFSHGIKSTKKNLDHEKTHFITSKFGIDSVRLIRFRYYFFGIIRFGMIR